MPIILNSEWLQEFLAYAAQLLQARITHQPSYHAIRQHLTLSSFGCFKLQHQPATFLTVSQKVNQLITILDILRQKVISKQEAFLSKNKAAKFENFEDFRSFFYKILRKDLRHPLFQGFLLLIWNNLVMLESKNALLQHLVLLCYGIFIPPRTGNLLCKSIAQKNYDILEEKHQSIPLLVPSPNLSDSTGLTPHLLGLHSKRFIKIDIKGFDPQIRPVRLKTQDFIVLQQTERSIEFRPQTWISLIREPQRYLQPKVEPTFRKAAFTIVVEWKSLLSTQKECYQVFLSDHKLRIDMKRPNSKGVMGDFSYLFKDGALYFFDHGEHQCELVRPVDHLTQTIVSRVKVDMLQQKNLKDEKEYKKVRISADLDEITICRDYLEGLELDKASQSIKDYEALVKTHSLIDYQALIKKGPIAFIKSYHPPDTISKQTKYKKKTTNLSLDLITCQPFITSMSQLHSVINILSLETTHFNKLQALFASFRTMAEQSVLSGRQPLLDPDVCFPYKLLLHMSLLKTLQVSIQNITNDFNSKVFDIGSGYCQSEHLQECLSARSSSVILTDEEFQKFMISGQGQEERQRESQPHSGGETLFRKKKRIEQVPIGRVQERLSALSAHKKRRM